MEIKDRELLSEIFNCIITSYGYYGEEAQNYYIMNSMKCYCRDKNLDYDPEEITSIVKLVKSLLKLIKKVVNR